MYGAHIFAHFLKNFRVSQRILIGVPNIKFPVNPSGGSRADTHGRMETTKLIGTSRDYAGANNSRQEPCNIYSNIMVRTRLFISSSHRNRP